MSGEVNSEEVTAPEIPQSAEQAADLAALAQSIAESEPLIAPAADAAPDEAPILSFGEEAEMAVDLFAEMAAAYEPSTEKFWPASTRKKVSVALAAVLKKYNISLLRSPEIALIAVAGPALYQTSKAIALAMSKVADAN